MGYLLAGTLVGPHTPGFVADASLAEQLAEIGVILLMFGVGLQFHVEELIAVRRVAIPGAVVQSGVATVLGAVIARTAGWDWSAGLIFGMAGWHKVFVMTPAGHAAQYFTGPYADSWIPYWLLFAAGVTVPFIELIGGWLLVIGWRVREALIALHSTTYTICSFVCALSYVTRSGAASLFCPSM